MDVNVAFLTVLLTTKSMWNSPEGLRCYRPCLQAQSHPLWTPPEPANLVPYHKGFHPQLWTVYCGRRQFCLFNEDIQVAVYVDDLLIFGADKANKAKVQHLKNALNGRFSMKDLGPVKWYMGIAIEEPHRKND
jgi:hypothetical protein